MKLLYKPFALAARRIGARSGRRAFEAAWGRVSDEPRPSANARRQGLASVAIAAAVEAATVAAAAAIGDQLAARAFRHLFGAWPSSQKS